MAEALAPFRGTGDLVPELLVRSGRPLALAELDLAADATLLHLDDPAVLVRERLRPSAIATGRRAVTQARATQTLERHPAAAGLRWPSMTRRSSPPRRTSAWRSARRSGRTATPRSPRRYRTRTRVV